MKTSHLFSTRLLMLFAVTLAPFTPAFAAIAEHVVRKNVASIDVIVYPMDVQNVVTLRGSLPAGDIYAQGGNIAAATLAGMMFDKGTTRQDKFAIAKQLDDAGARLGFRVAEQAASINGKALAKDLPLLIHLLAEELRTPAFNADEFSKAKKQLQAATRSQLDDTSYRAHELFSRTVYPEGHPNRYLEVSEWLDAIQRATLDDIKAFHHKHYGPAHLTLVFVGDVDAQKIQSLIAKEFSGWSGGVDLVRSANGGAIQALREQRVDMKDKASVTVLLGQPTGLRYQDADSLPLRIGTAILGTGFTGRLMSSVRDKEGLTYGIGAGISDDTFVDGTFAISATFAPALLQRGLVSTRRELQRWYEDGVTAVELADRKTSLIGSYQVGLASTEGTAQAILQTLNRGKDLAWMDELPKAIDRVTLEQVNSAIKKHLDPARMVVVEAGTFEPAVAANSSAH
jgi:zinc protease